MREIEVKILDIDRRAVEERLIELGARKVFDDEVYAMYYDTADRKIHGNNGMLRLRSEGGRTTFTFKGHVEETSAKVREEREVTVSDIEDMQAILSSLDFMVWLEMRKHRTTYVLESVHFELDKYLDKYEYIPEFLEIEGQDLPTIRKYAALLGFQEEDCRPWDALQVAAYYQKKKGSRDAGTK